MWRWALILALAALLTLGAVIYLIRCFHRLTPIRRLGERHRALAWLATCAPLAAVASFALINVTTMGVALLHLALAFLLTGAACALVGRLRGRPVSPNWRAGVAVGITVVYLAVGWYMAHHVFETRYTLSTEKPLPNGSLRVVMVADAHLGATLDGPGFAAQTERIRKLRPDAVVIVGDFVDDETTASDMLAACRALGGLETTYGVYYVYGNHDRGYYSRRDFTAADLQAALEDNGVTILADEAVLLGERWYLVGRKDRSMAGRLDAAALTEDLDASRYIVLLDHQPNDYAAEAATPADLVLSGHSHGGHIFPLGQLAVLFGAGDRRYGHENRDGTDFIVTSGISGWAIPIKTGTWSEFVVVDIQGK